MSSNYNEYIYNIYEAFLHKQDVAKEIQAPSWKCRIFSMQDINFSFLFIFHQEIRQEK